MKSVLAGGLAAALLAGGFAKVVAADAASPPVTCDAPSRDRVDLGKPSFSNPTTITNPLFPRGDSGQSIELGAEAGEKLRFEVTYLPDTRVFHWDGRNVATRVTHFVAYKEGRILETAVDYYAQDDAGNVWYFGEDVSNYENGVEVDKEGTWFAGKDGPPGMIMPAQPKVGDVYRPENIPGLVFEEVTVKATGTTVQGPRGKVRDAIFIQECLMDGTLEEKQFAPGYGEFRAVVKSKDEVYDLALAVPADSLRRPVPNELGELSEGAGAVFDAVPTARWGQIARTVDSMERPWHRLEKRQVPRFLHRQMDDALDALQTAVDDRHAAGARQAALDVGHAGLDLELRSRPQAEVDRARIRLWEDQLLLDQEAADAGAVAGDQVIIRSIRDRIR